MTTHKKAISGAHSQLTMQVVNHVRAMIESGELHSGDRLPPERELARKLKISRSSLRAGIGFLSAMGVLRSRHGAGTFVSDGPPSFDSNSLTVLGALHGFQPWHLFEARLVLEGSLAELAANRATDEHIAIMAEEIADMYAVLDNPYDFLIHDVRFHRIISVAGGNPLLATLMETVTAALYELRRHSVAASDDLKVTADMHREIYRAIRARKPSLAREAMEKHLNLARHSQSADIPDSHQTSTKPRAPRARRPSVSAKN